MTEWDQPEADPLGDVRRAMTAWLGVAPPDPIVEIRVTQQVYDGLRARAQEQTAATVPATMSSTWGWGIPMVIDDTLPPSPGYEAVRASDRSRDVAQLGDAGAANHIV